MEFIIGVKADFTAMAILDKNKGVCLYFNPYSRQGAALAERGRGVHLSDSPVTRSVS